MATVPSPSGDVASHAPRLGTSAPALAVLGECFAGQKPAKRASPGQLRMRAPTIIIAIIPKAIRRSKASLNANQRQQRGEQSLGVEHAAVRESNICVTFTTSREALLCLEDVTPGTFIAVPGADNPEKQELQPGLIAKSKVVADGLEQCPPMGDLHHALETAAITLSDVHAELGEVVAGEKPGRQSDDEIIVFDSTQ